MSPTKLMTNSIRLEIRFTCRPLFKRKLKGFKGAIGRQNGTPPQSLNQYLENFSISQKKELRTDLAPPPV